ncbi:hypothetical protein [Yoonia sp.]|uniref:hypothetical protein n=1 Tax=Yoonia sp. TaxID=2212373 RepID=UPI00391D37BA
MAAPAPLAFSELPTALQSGVFDGQENPLTNIYASGIHEITPFLTLTGHRDETTPVVAGLGWRSGLSRIPHHRFEVDAPHCRSTIMPG